MTHGKNFFMILAAVVFCSLSGITHAEDEYAKKAMSLTARDFDIVLPDQPIDGWLQSNIPTGYEAVWGEHITDCGEGTGTAVDKERDMPICLEAELKEGPEIKGYLALFVGTEKQGPLKSGYGLYSGYLDHNGKRYTFGRLSDVLKVK
jgi:hypothetical protein